MLLAIIAGGLMVAAAHGIIKRYAPEFAPLLLTAFAAVAAAALTPYILSLVGQITGGAIDGDENITILVKIISINIIAGSAADICTDCGVKSAGNLVLLAAQAVSIGLALPILSRLVSLINGLLQ